MDKNKKNEILKKAICKYTPKKQLVKLQEECGELITAISKYLLDPYNLDNFKNLTEESVDVRILLEQFFDNVYANSLVNEIEEEKLIRLDERLENGL